MQLTLKANESLFPEQQRRQKGAEASRGISPTLLVDGEEL